jgi:hypothetical protein
VLADCILTLSTAGSFVEFDSPRAPNFHKASSSSSSSSDSSSNSEDSDSDSDESESEGGLRRWRKSSHKSHPVRCLVIAAAAAGGAS